MADNRNFVNKFANQGGGDIFVEDAKLSEISTKTAIASEGVMLKGTDGAYYEIDKASLSEVIRAELGAILADNSKNNGTSVAKVPTLNSSGNALGASSVADLASVLGAKPMHYDGEGIANGMPTDYGAYFKAGVGAGIFKIHLFHANSATGGLLYHQLTSGETPSGSGWVPVYDTSLLTNQTMLTTLASALSAAFWKYITLSGVGTEGKLFTSANACVFILLYDGGARCGVYSYDRESGTIETILAAPRVVVGAHTDNTQYYMWVNNGDIYISSATSNVMRFNYLVFGI